MNLEEQGGKGAQWLFVILMLSVLRGAIMLLITVIVMRVVAHFTMMVISLRLIMAAVEMPTGAPWTEHGQNDQGSCEE